MGFPLQNRGFLHRISSDTVSKNGSPPNRLYRAFCGMLRINILFRYPPAPHTPPKPRKPGFPGFGGKSADFGSGPVWAGFGPVLGGIPPRPGLDRFWTDSGPTRPGGSGPGPGGDLGRVLGATPGDRGVYPSDPNLDLPRSGVWAGRTQPYPCQPLSAVRDGREQVLSSDKIKLRI